MHPNGKFAYVVSEMGASVTAFAYDNAHGSMARLQIITTLPSGFTGRKEDAEIEVHPSGKFLYASNRGHDSIVVYSIDQDRGTLTPVGDVPSGGKEPRHFAIDPSGKFLLAENQNTNTIVEFLIDPVNGKLTRE